jgi:hypothetical protein
MKVLRAAQELKKAKPRRVNMNIKVYEEEKKHIEDMAKKCTNGNVTTYVRIAVRKFRPRSRDFVSVK